MSRILIPRSSNISAKKVETSDFEKYFNTDFVQDYIICGFTVSEQCPDILGVDVASGNARVKGLHLNNSVSCTVNCLTMCATNKIYLNICRDGCCEADEWTFGKTTGCVPACGYHIANVVTAACTVTSICQGVTVRVNKNQFGFVGTGTQIAAICPTYSGMNVFATDTTSCFIIDKAYTRNAANCAWVRDASLGQALDQLYPLNTTIGDYSQPCTAVATSVAFTQCTIMNNLAGRDSAHNMSVTLTRVGEKVETACSALIGKVIEKVSLELKANGSPSGTGTLRIRDACDVIKATIGSINVATLGCFAPIDFINFDNCYVTVENDRIVFEHCCSTACNFVGVGVDLSDGFDGGNSVSTLFNGGCWTDESCRDSAMAIFTRGSPATNAVDDCTASPWQSMCENNPAIYVDMGSAKELVAFAIRFDTVVTTETEVQIRYSTDATFTAGETVRTLLISDFTDDTYRFISIPRQSADKRFIQIFGSNNSKVMRIFEIKYLDKSAAQFDREHYHEFLDTTSTASSYTDSN